MSVKVRKLQVLRRTVQFLVLALVLAIPAVSRYNNYLAARELDKNLERWDGSLQGHALTALDATFRALPEGEMVMLKLTIPEKAGLYDDLAEHANVLRVVALSGGYSTAEACERLGKNRTMIASFSRALTERLNVKMTDAEFNTALGQNIEKIYQASIC